jgi:SAM-dependent methyltransferase
MVMYNIFRVGFCLLLLLFSHVSFASQQLKIDGFIQVASTILKPVYGPLAEQIVDDYNLADLKGIGIDLGSGPGDLIIELCKRTRHLHWINADINPGFFPEFIRKTEKEGFSDRVSAIYADAVKLPFRDNYADIIVSRGSFQLWDDLKAGLSEVYRVLKPGGKAYIGRGFSSDLPVEVAREIRNRQKKGGKGLKYDVNETTIKMKTIMGVLNIQDFRVIIPDPPGAENISYGIWLEFHKP